MSANIPAELAALPIEEMIGGPLQAAMKAQAMAAMTTVSFITDVGLDDDNKIRNVIFKYTRKSVSEKDGTVKSTEGSFEAPLLTIMPIPYIRIRDMSINFNFKINTSSLDTATQTFKGSLTASAKWGWGKAKLSASYGYEKTQRSSADRSAELNIVVNAVQDIMPEGLAQTLSILKDLIIAEAPEPTPPSDVLTVTSGGAAKSKTKQ